MTAEGAKAYCGAIMGTDIHSVLEYRKNGMWHCATAQTTDEYGVDFDDQPLDDRNYGLFGILANVRNGHGFAGIVTGEPVPPMTTGRGIPHDVTNIVRDWFTASDWHTPSWVTLDDVLHYDWTRYVQREGVLDADVWVDFENYGRKYGKEPRSWCGDISGSGVVRITEDEMRVYVDSLRDMAQTTSARWRDWTREGHPVDKKQRFCRTTWSVRLFDLSGDLLNRCVPMMLGLKLQHGIADEDVRVVFGFDS